MATWKVVLESEEMPLDHANDMTYDPVRKHLVVVNMLNNLVSVIDPETLTLTESKTLAYGTWGVGYIDGADQYTFLAYGSPSGLVIADGDFTPIRATALADTTGYVGQGMDADAKYAYVPLSPDGGTKDNVIQIFDINTGEYLGKVSVKTTMESESMFHVGDDIYLHFNNQGAKIATLEFYERFE
jgi:DNA-binding beta-propeller fold protein YncE